LRRELAHDLSPAARGLVYQLEQGLGTVLTCEARAPIMWLTDADRDRLVRLDVALGRHVVYVRTRLKPRFVRQRMALCLAGPHLGPPGAVSWAVSTAVSDATYLAVGYPVVGPRAVRADVLERANQHLEHHGRKGLAAVLGCRSRQLPAVLGALERLSETRG
jgi:ATP-dependent RNA helicase SUPV3L1/SUV3